MIAVDAEGCLAVFGDPPIAAAHSMDTDWYAIDAEGRVGRMWSGETGAVPWTAHRADWRALLETLVVARVWSPSPEEPWSELAVLRGVLEAATDPVERALVTGILGGDATSRAVYIDWLEANAKVIDGFPLAHAIYEVGRDLRRRSVDALPESWDCILRFTDPAYLAMFAAERWRFHGPCRVLEEGLGVSRAAAVTELYRHGFTEFWEAGAIEVVLVIPDGLEPRDLGVYDYECSFGPTYRRVSIPDRPLRFDDLPELLRENLGAARLPTSFASTKELDPTVFVDCQIY